MTEITKGNVPGCCHPHFHCLLLVPLNYFQGRKYLNHQAWRLMWRKYAGLEYDPQVDVKVVKGNYQKIIPELIKYASKNADLLDRDFLLVYLEQMKNYHLTEIGGVISNYIHSVEPDNLINSDLDDGDYRVTENVFYFRWQQSNLVWDDGNNIWDYQLES